MRGNAIGSMCQFATAVTNVFDFWKTTAKNDRGVPQANAVFGLKTYNQLSPDLIPTLENMITNGDTWQREVARDSLEQLQEKATGVRP